MGSDFGDALEDLESFRSLLDAYFARAQRLTADEAAMLMFGLQTKAAAIAAWAANEFASAVGTARVLFQTWYVQALRCILFLAREQDAIRTIAQSHVERRTAPSTSIRSVERRERLLDTI